MSLEKYSAQKINDATFRTVEHLIRINRLAHDMVNESTETDEDQPERMISIAQSLEQFLNQLPVDFEIIKNASVTLSRSLAGQLDNEDEVEIDVIETENGVKF